MAVIMERNVKYMNREERKVHLTKWSNFRLEVFNEATSLFGKMNKDNLKDFQKYMKTEEKKWKEGKR